MLEKSIKVFALYWASLCFLAMKIMRKVWNRLQVINKIYSDTSSKIKREREDETSIKRKVKTQPKTTIASKTFQ